MSEDREKKSGEMANDDEMADVEAHKKAHRDADGTATSDDDDTSGGDDVEAHMKNHKV